jgi:hypothetical protein
VVCLNGGCHGWNGAARKFMDMDLSYVRGCEVNLEQVVRQRVEELWSMDRSGTKTRKRFSRMQRYAREARAP